MITTAQHKEGGNDAVEEREGRQRKVLSAFNVAAMESCPADGSS